MSCIQPPDYYRKPLLPNSIRLLRLLPNEDKTAPIQCELFHYSLQESGTRTHPYDALSYVWGGSDKPQSIFIGEYNSTSGHDSTSEHELPVTENLHEALSRLRNRSIERIIWIDAVCINQEDEREKEQQIQFIAKIYAQANRVIVWLGEATEDSDQALQEIRVAGGKKSKISSSNETIQQAVITLLQRPWFRRIWVLQEVAAARHILIMCGLTEIDGYAFYLGLESFEWFDETRVDLQGLARSVTYLIREAIFRPDFSMSRSGRTSLDICPLGELVDMYHAHNATKRHDKVFALLGMSSDDLSKANLLPDYRVPWEELLQRLAKYLLCKEISVETWGSDREIAVIKSKGCILGKVSLVQSDTVQDDREGVDVIFKNRDGSARLTLQASAKSIQDGDIVCLLQGASKPTIIRRCQDYFNIIIIAARPPESIPMGGGYTEWPKLLQSGMPFTRDFILLWDWENSLKKFEQPEGYEALIQTNNRMLEYPTEFEGYLDKANRIWNVALILGDLEEYQEAEEKLQEAIKGYEIAFGVQHPSWLKSKYGLTPLSWAARNGYDAVVRLLLAKDGVDPDLNDSQYGQTPLSWAAEGGHETVVKLLLETGKVEVDSKDTNGQTPLWTAAARGYEAVVKLLLETGKVEVDLKDKYGQTPLRAATTRGYEAVVKLLLETGKAKVDSKDRRNGQTPLWTAATRGYEAVVKLLLETGKVEVNLKDRNGKTLLLWAAERGRKAVVKLLLETGKVEVNSKDRNGRTPLQRAAEEGHEAVVKLLLEIGNVDVDSKDRYGQTPLSLAAERGHKAVVKLLLETGKVEVDSKDRYGRTPLSWAAERGRKAVVKLLLETGKVEIDLKDRYGRTPLSWAAEGGHEGVVKLLLETGKVEVNSKDRYGQTPLLWAAKGGYEGVVKLLLEIGKVEVDSKDRYGRTPLSWAAERGHKAVVMLLQSSAK